MDENDTTMQLKSLPSPPKKKNVAPENQWLEDEISLWDGLFSGANC